MPLAPNIWPLPYIVSYTMICDPNGTPLRYSFTVRDKSTGNSLSGETVAPDPVELNVKVKQLVDQLYP